MKKAAVFNDLSGFGKCSLTAAIPVLSAQGVQCCPMASAVLTNQTGYEYHKCTDLTAMIKDYIDNWQKNNAHFDGIYSGFMTGSKQIELFMDFLDVFYEENTMLLVDPVMGDDGRTYGIYSAALLDGMKALSRKADVITPNLTEACLLADYDIEKVYSDTRKDVLLPLATEISEKLRDLSGKNQDVIITGIKCRDDKSPFIYNLVTTANGTTTHRSHFFDVSFSGTGDLFASVICGSRLNGFSTEEAAERAGKFLYDSSVDRFLDALTSQEKFPFSTDDLRNELKHTFWLLNRVDSAKALAKKLKAHPVFKDYEIVLAAGDGRLSADEENKKAYNKVVDAIRKYDKTITLSVGQLTTGITIPEWTAVLMLSNVKSPALYMQTAFRSQNPCMFSNGSEFFRKKNAYIFDFDPARTLVIYEQFANDLSAETSDGRGDSDTHKNNVRTLLNFFPVIGEDENGKMIELDAEKVLSIPRKIRSKEVVRRGFMSDFLFQNISNVFKAPQEVIDIIKNFTPVAEPNSNLNITTETGDDLSLDDNGNVNIDDNFVIGTATEVFGDKIYDITDSLNDSIDNIELENDSKKDTLEDLKKIFKKQVTEPLIDSAKEHYGENLSKSSQKRLEKKIEIESDKKINAAYGDFSIKSKELEKEYKDKLEEASAENKQKIRQEYKKKVKEVRDEFKQALSEQADNFVEQLGQEVVRTVETEEKEREKKDLEGGIKDHLRGFSRTIPSFLMAYGDNEVTLENFDRIIPDNVFVEVTSITLEQFRFLRDGGDYTNPETGETEHFNGQLFDSVVFNDSVKEFMNLKKQLANYFDESNKEDIFDYIPPQKTNQIFTPKRVVKKMVDELEKENPNCFDNPEHTFIDPYMKSGMFITEIVKRLYQSQNMKKLFSDDKERLTHIFEKQVYGLAPTEIIYRIAISYILGFSNDSIRNHNFRQVDALEYAKSGTLQQKIDELFG